VALSGVGLLGLFHPGTLFFFIGLSVQGAPLGLRSLLNLVVSFVFALLLPFLFFFLPTFAFQSVAPGFVATFFLLLVCLPADRDGTELTTASSTLVCPVFLPLHFYNWNSFEFRSCR